MEMRSDWPDGVDVEKLSEAVSIVSARVYSKYRTVRILDDADVSQELWLFAWRKRDKVQEYMDREGRQAQRKGWSALLTMLQRAAERYCQKMKAKEGGYELVDLVWYTPDAIKDWIGVLINGTEVLTNQMDDDKIKRSALANEGWNLEATLADINAALDSLDVTERAMMIEAYGNSVPHRTIAEVFEISESTLERRLRDSLKKMVEFLGGERPW